MIIRTLLILQNEGNEELFKNYIELLHDCNINLREVFLCLQEKGIILKTGFKVPLTSVASSSNITRKPP